MFSDPRQWTIDQVHQWIGCQCHEFNVPQPNLSYFNYCGADLCNLKEEYFRYYAPDAYSTLMYRLEIWKSGKSQL